MVNEQDRGQIDDEQTVVDASGGLTKDCFYDGIGGISAGKLQVRRLRVGRDALEHELPDESVLPLVPFQRGRGKTQADDGNKNEDGGERQQRPGIISAPTRTRMLGSANARGNT